jgi:hypothetical protein
MKESSDLFYSFLGLDHHFDPNVGANLMFALEQLFANVFSSRANTRFAPTLGSPQRFHLAETMIKAIFTFNNWTDLSVQKKTRLKYKQAG